MDGLLVVVNWSPYHVLGYADDIMLAVQGVFSQKLTNIINCVAICSMVKYVSVTLDSKLTWNEHLANTLRKVRCVLFQFDTCWEFPEVRRHP